MAWGVRPVIFDAEDATINIEAVSWKPAKPEWNRQGGAPKKPGGFGGGVEGQGLVWLAKRARGRELGDDNGWDLVMGG